MPGTVAMVSALRAAGITVIANTNRSAANAAGTEATLRAAGLGEFKHGETLFLAGDDADGSSKDGRRATIAARWCVIAMAGDQLGDFSQQFNDRPEEHTSELQSLMRISYAVLCLKKTIRIFD